MKNQIVDLNYNNYDNYLRSGVVLVDFWAEWCHPCKMQHKIVEEIAAEHDQMLTVARLNVDDNKVISTKLAVTNIPTLILYKDGVELRRIIGLQSKKAVMNQINNALITKKTA
jgi:thioredoxin 1